MARRLTKITQVRQRAVDARRQVQETAHIARSQLHVERERLITMFESISDAFMAVDREYRFTYLNPRAVDLLLKLTAQSHDAFISKTIWDAVPGSYDSALGEIYRRVMTEGTSTQFAAFFAPLNSWFDARVYPSNDGLSIYLADVTQHHRAQDALRDAEERLRMMIDSAKDYSIYTVDIEGRFTSWNSGGERMFGYTDGEILGQHERLIYNPEDRAVGIPEREMRKALEVGYSENERWHLHKDGRLVYGSGMVRPLYDDRGTHRGFTKVMRDETARKATEARMHLLQALASELSGQLTASDMARSILQASQTAVGGSAASLFLLRSEEQGLEHLLTEGLSEGLQAQWQRLPLDMPLPMTDAVREKRIIWCATQDDYIQRYPQLQESIITHRLQGSMALPLILDGTTVGVILISYLYAKAFSREEQELLTAIIHLCGQALERARLYEAEKQARQEAEKANDLKMQFLAMISHELRTPLASIKGFTTTLLKDDLTFTPEDQRMFLSIVNEETDRLTDLVEQLLDLSRLQAGTLRIDAEPQSFDAVLEVAQTQLQTLTKRHFLELYLADSLPLVHVDRQRIAQVLVNLVANAVKFSPEGTPIAIHVFQNNDMVQVDVNDQGIGIPLEERTNIFEAFRQVDRKIPSQRLGAGLGLAISKGIVEAHRGHIWVQDQAVGTTISFVLPALLIN